MDEVNFHWCLVEERNNSPVFMMRGYLFYTLAS